MSRHHPGWDSVALVKSSEEDVYYRIDSMNCNGGGQCLCRQMVKGWCGGYSRKVAEEKKEKV